MTTIIAFHSTKGGVGTTTLTAHTCALAREHGIRVAGLSFDPTGELARWLAPLDIPCLDGRREEQPTADVELLVVDIHSQTESIPLDPDLWVVPLDTRLSYDHALRLADRLRGPVVWLANHVHAPGFCTRFEIPADMDHVQQLLPGVSRSRAIATAGDECRIVWHRDDGARPPGAILLRSALGDVLSAAGFRLRELAPPPPSPVPGPDASATTRQAYAVAAALIDAELRAWPSPRLRDLAGEGLLGEDESHPDLRRDLAALAASLWQQSCGELRRGST